MEVPWRRDGLLSLLLGTLVDLDPLFASSSAFNIYVRVARAPVGLHVVRFIGWQSFPGVESQPR